MAHPDSNWFIETCHGDGVVSALRVRGRCEQVNSCWQTIEIWDTETFGYLMTLDDIVMLTSRDNFLYHEMMAHPALFTHPGPERVAIIGGGDCGTLREVLRHDNVAAAWQIDIDDQVTRLAELYFPELCVSNQDPRASLRFENGIDWVRNRATASLDVIIIDSTDPVGHAADLYQPDFLADCYRALGPDGVLVQQSESPLLHHQTIIKDLRHAMATAGFAESRVVTFPQPVYPSGWWSCTLASKRGDLSHFRHQDAHDAALSTQYYAADIHQAALVVPPFMKAD